MTPSFSSGEKVQVAYRIWPPRRTSGAAFSRMRSWRLRSRGLCRCSNRAALGIAGEHAFTGAGGVHQHRVEKAGPQAASCSGTVLVIMALVTPIRSRFIASTEVRRRPISLATNTPSPSSARRCGWLCSPELRLGLGPFARLRIQQQRRSHGRRILHIEHARSVIGMRAERGRSFERRFG